MKFRQTKWYNDPRSKRFSHHKLFGTLAPKTLLYSLSRANGYLHNQGNTLRCTGYGTAAEGECIHGVVMDPDWAAYKIGKKQGYSVDTSGGDPNATMKHMRDDGFLPLGVGPFSLGKDGVEGSGYSAPWPASLDAEAKKWDTVPGFVKVDGPYDIFDNVRSALQMAYDPTTKLGAGVDVFGRWFNEWTNSSNGIVPQSYGDFAGYHRYVFVDWVVINGVPYLKCKNSYGPMMGAFGFQYFPREVVNREFSGNGTSLKICKTLTKAQYEEAKKETWMGGAWRTVINIWFILSERFGATIAGMKV